MRVALSPPQPPSSMFRLIHNCRCYLRAPFELRIGDCYRSSSSLRPIDGQSLSCESERLGEKENNGNGDRQKIVRSISEDGDAHQKRRQTVNRCTDFLFADVIASFCFAFAFHGSVWGAVRSSVLTCRRNVCLSFSRNLSISRDL